MWRYLTLRLHRTCHRSVPSIRIKMMRLMHALIYRYICRRMYLGVTSTKVVHNREKGCVTVIREKGGATVIMVNEKREGNGQREGYEWSASERSVKDRKKMPTHYTIHFWFSCFDHKCHLRFGRSRFPTIRKGKNRGILMLSWRKVRLRLTTPCAWTIWLG